MSSVEIFSSLDTALQSQYIILRVDNVCGCRLLESYVTVQFIHLLLTLSSPVMPNG